MSSKGNLWIFSELFFPDDTSTGYIFTEIAKELSLSENVIVITENCSDSYGLTANNQNQGIESQTLKVIRLKGLKLNKNNIFQRILKILITSIRFCYKFIVLVRPGDRVLMVTNPAPVLLGIAFLKIFKRTPVYLVVHDVFPENLKAASLAPNKVLLRILQGVFDRAYKMFNHIVVLGRDMEKVVRAKVGSDFEGITVIENWSDTENLYPKKTDKFNNFRDNRISYLFAGNIGRLQGLREVIGVFGKHKNNVTLTIIGYGALKEELKTWCSLKEFDNVLFLDPVGRECQVDFINSFDVSLVTLSPLMYGLGVPSKTYNIIACGKPILYFGPRFSEVDLMIGEHALGWSSSCLIDFEECLSIIDRNAISKLSPERIRTIALENYSKKSIMAKFKELFMK